ncbi:MAG: hypothetical protein AAFQ82_16660 [Myxococcota bacterium]
MSVLSAADRERITAVIAEVEATTAGEVVVATVSRSGEYSIPRVPIAIAFSAATTLAIHSLLALSAPQAILAQLVLAMMFYAVTGAGVLVRLLVPSGELDERSRARAFELFSDLGVHRTTDGSGILLAISELEHRVVILADYGIHARVGEHEWQQHVDAIVRGIAEGRATDSIIAEIKTLGTLLTQEFPAEGENRNQLGNEVEHRDR